MAEPCFICGEFTLCMLKCKCCFICRKCGICDECEKIRFLYEPCVTVYPYHEQMLQKLNYQKRAATCDKLRDNLCVICLSSFVTTPLLTLHSKDENNKYKICEGCMEEIGDKPQREKPYIPCVNCGDNEAKYEYVKCGHEMCKTCMIKDSIAATAKCSVCRESFNVYRDTTIQPEGTMVSYVDPDISCSHYENHCTIVVNINFPSKPIGSL